MVAIPPAGAHPLQRRWDDADGEKVGLWMGLGVVVALIVLALIVGGYNRFLGYPLAQLRKLKDADARLEAMRDDLADRDRRLADKDALLGQRAASITAKDQQLAAMSRQRDANQQQLRERADRLAELTGGLRAAEAEVATLRPRVGAQEDSIRDLRRDLAQRQRDVEAGTKRNNALAKKLAWVTAQMANKQQQQQQKQEGNAAPEAGDDSSKEK